MNSTIPKDAMDEAQATVLKDIAATNKKL
jgi:hypothetical protein